MLEGILRWAVDIHFRRCSIVLQASLYRTACDGVRQALDAATVASGRVSPPSFPLTCRLLLSFVGGLAGDDGAFVASFLQKRCAAELLPFVAPANSMPWTRSTEGRAVMGAAGLQLPVLEGYVGHLCLCRHVSDTTAGSHLLWLSRQALVALRLLDSPSPLGTAQHQQQSSGEISAVLRSLSHALALLLTRPMRGSGSASGVPDNAGNLLEILFDSEARPLADLPRPLAEAALGVLQKAGFLQLARSEVLLGSYPARTAEREIATAKRSDAGVAEPDAKAGVKGDCFSDGVDFRRASFAFNRSWSLAAAGVDAHLPLIKRQRGLEGLGDGDSRDSASEDSDEGESEGSCENESTRENGWGSVPDEVALRVFSFLTPKRVCRLMCVDRAWRDLLLVERVWKPLFEARWPLKGMKDGEDLARASEKLLGATVSVGDGKRKRKRGKSNVVHWQLPEVSHLSFAARTSCWKKNQVDFVFEVFVARQTGRLSVDTWGRPGKRGAWGKGQEADLTPEPTLRRWNSRTSVLFRHKASYFTNPNTPKLGCGRRTRSGLNIYLRHADSSAPLRHSRPELFGACLFGLDVLLYAC